MPTIPNKSEFEPNQDALNQWLSTRKATHYIGGINIPGFLNDSRFDIDLNWTYVAIIGELLGMILTIYGGFNLGGKYVIISLGVVIGFVFFDIISAVKLHRTKARSCWIDNYLYLYGEDNPQKRNQYILERKKWKLRDFFFIMLIILSLLIKVVAIIVLSVFSNIFVYIPILIIYIVVGYVHVYHTGYWIASWKTSKMFRKQFEQGNSINAKTRSYPFTTENELDHIPIKQGRHRVIKRLNKEDTENEYNYELSTIGILTDEDIIYLIDGQERFQKLELFENCRIHQFDNFQIDIKKTR